MNKYEVLISESFGVKVEVDAESQEQAMEDAMSYAVLDNVKELRRTHNESFVVEVEQLEEKEWTMNEYDKENYELQQYADSLVDSVIELEKKNAELENECRELRNELIKMREVRWWDIIEKITMIIVGIWFY